MKNNTTQLRIDYTRAFYSTKNLLAFSVSVMILSYFTTILPQPILHNLTAEDGVFENFGALLFLSSSIVFFLGFFKERTDQYFLFQKVNRNYSYLLLGMLFFFVFAEEISWGQRIFNTQTGSYFLEKNIQKETNLHNLKIFNSINEFNEKRPWWDIFSMSRLFRLFWFILCILIPFSNKFFASSQNFFQKIGIPIFPMSTGLLLAGNYLSLKYFEGKLSYEVEVVEIEECLTAFLFFMASVQLVAFAQSKDLRQQENYA